MMPSTLRPPPEFHPTGLDAASILTYAHIGDLHLVERGAQNHQDLLAIVKQLNACFAAHTSFVYLPGDNADHGDLAAYAAVREALDQLRLPWCAIVGDHDVHEKSHRNFQAALSSQLHYSFTVGPIRFLALNAFDVPAPPSFSILQPQLEWITAQLAEARHNSQYVVLLLHCYPGDLKQGREALQQLVKQYRPLLIDMGHTHYNELSNDGHTLYAATRSTGQIEEGPVGFSITCLDCSSPYPSLSWRFFSLKQLQAGEPAVLITAPSDARLATHATPDAGATVRASIWAVHALSSVWAVIGNNTPVAMHLIADSNTWACDWPGHVPIDRASAITVTATTASGVAGSDTIHFASPAVNAADMPPSPNGREDHYAVSAWPEHGLLGTQLGPNKNGRKW